VYCSSTDAVDEGSRVTPPETYQEEGAPASDVREAHGDALVLPEAQPHVAALLADHSCHPKHGLGATLAQVCVTLMTCTAKHPQLPASDIADACDLTLDLLEAWAHAAARLPNHLGHPERGLGAALAQVCVTSMSCAFPEPSLITVPFRR